MPPKMGGVNPVPNLDNIEEAIDLQKLEGYRKSFLESLGSGSYDEISLENVPLQYRREMALGFIKDVKPGYVIEYLGKYNFNIATENEIALKTIEIGGLKNVAERVRSFKKLDREVALTLIEAGEGYNVIIGIDHIGGMNIEEACKRIFTGKNPKAEESAKFFLGKEWLDAHGIV
jgi:hypothetical protein